jgi:acetylornithine deacetylase/succinyl-diaminopimelate desuccinylase-like protein
MASVLGTTSLDALAGFLRTLVRVPSVNPPGNEGPVAALLLDRLRALGLEGRIVESAPGRPNVLAHLAGSGRGPTLLLNGHMDVQPPAADWTRDPFGGEREGTRLYGRGYSVSGMPDESVDLRDVATAASIYARLILNLLG